MLSACVLKDEEARGLEHSSRTKSRTILERQFLPFCEARKFVHIDQILPIDLTEFRSTWNNGDVTTHRKHERMYSFFSFCVADDMLRKNPMDALKKPKTPDIVPTDYFLPEESEKIVTATDRYKYGGGNDSKHRAQRIRALTLLMRCSGLAILDATSLERERLSKNENNDDQIFLYRAKNPFLQWGHCQISTRLMHDFRGRASRVLAPQEALSFAALITAKKQTM
jgi:site-specific recombinase XerD